MIILSNYFCFYIIRFHNNRIQHFWQQLVSQVTQALSQSTMYGLSGFICKILDQTFIRDLVWEMIVPSVTYWNNS